MKRISTALEIIINQVQLITMALILHEYEEASEYMVENVLQPIEQLNTTIYYDEESKLDLALNLREPLIEITQCMEALEEIEEFQLADMAQEISREIFKLMKWLANYEEMKPTYTGVMA